MFIVCNVTMQSRSHPSQVFDTLPSSIQHTIYAAFWHKLTTTTCCILAPNIQPAACTGFMEQHSENKDTKYSRHFLYVLCSLVLLLIYRGAMQSADTVKGPPILFVNDNLRNGTTARGYRTDWTCLAASHTPAH
uniref:Uncharacterized protein n=1 Tax=Cacopsylla melanoneura TaxID=428564 RepID=A0A8D9BR25_9HEMI